MRKMEAKTSPATMTSTARLFLHDLTSFAIGTIHEKRRERVDNLQLPLQHPIVKFARLNLVLSDTLIT